MNALVTTTPTNAEVYRASTDAAGLCREIVLKTAMKIQGRQYVKAEGWLAIAIAHGCIASADQVERVNDDGMGGFRAIGIVRRMSDGAELSRAEGFVGDDEKMWAGRPVYARRAMVQTRAISRACRSAFAHVVVMIDANLSTTPAEEVPMGGFQDDEPRNVTPGPSAHAAKKAGLGPRANELLHELQGLESRGAILGWSNARADEIKAMPDKWRFMIREEVATMRAIIDKRAIEDGTADFDEIVDDETGEITPADDVFPGDLPAPGAGGAVKATPIAA